MKRLSFIALFIPILAAAGTVSVVSSFSSPDSFSNGLAWDGTNLWLHGGFMDGFYEISTSGTVLGSFTPSQPGGANACGCTFDGTNLRGLYLIDTGHTGGVYEYETDGTYVSYFTITGTANYCFGLTHDGTNLWISCKYDNTIYEVTESGTIVSSFASPVAAPYDLGYNGTNILVAGGSTLYEVTTTGTLVDTFSLSGICTTATGLTYDGSHIWITDQTTDIIYELEIAGVGIKSASLGTIKSMYK